MNIHNTIFAATLGKSFLGSSEYKLNMTVKRKKIKNKKIKVAKTIC